MFSKIPFHYSRWTCFFRVEIVLELRVYGLFFSMRDLLPDPEVPVLIACSVPVLCSSEVVNPIGVNVTSRLYEGRKRAGVWPVWSIL